MIEKHTRNSPRQWIFAAALLTACTAAASVHAQSPAAAPTFPVGNFDQPVALHLPSLPVTAPITPDGTVVEDVIARVNDQIITRSEFARAEQQLLQEAQQQNLSEADLLDRRHNLLRDMIDQQLLLAKGKDLGISGDAETMRQLDEIRKQNHLDSMAALQKAAEQQGVSFEDFKQRIRNSAITQQVVSEEVGRHLNLTHAEEETYYAAHRKDFEVPEQVHLSEILTPTPDTPTDAQIAAAQSQADALEAKLKSGANFAALAKSSSGGPTASAGGDLGDFKRGTLGDVLEKATFSLPAGGFTAPIRTRQGFVILRVDSHQAAGVPPLSDPNVQEQVEQALYLNDLQPALRAYLTKAREDAYIDIKPGFVDSGAPTHASSATFTAYAPPPIKKKNLRHQRAQERKAAIAQAELAAARAKVSERNAERAAEQAAKHGGARNASHAYKPRKIRREKIRFGQAPRNALPAAPLEAVEGASKPLAGQAPGVAMAEGNSDSMTITTGEEAQANPLNARPVTGHKTRYSQSQPEANDQHLENKVAKADVKASIRPVAATPAEADTEKVQAAPLGLKGDTVKKKKKPHVKGAPKERIQEETKPVEKTQPVAPTVNPDLDTPAVPTTAPASTPH